MKVLSKQYLCLEIVFKQQKVQERKMSSTKNVSWYPRQELRAVQIWK